MREKRAPRTPIRRQLADESAEACDREASQQAPDESDDEDDELVAEQRRERDDDEEDGGDEPAGVVVADLYPIRPDRQRELLVLFPLSISSTKQLTRSGDERTHFESSAPARTMKMTRAHQPQYFRFWTAGPGDRRHADGRSYG